LRKKITDIFEERRITRKEKNKLGEWEEVKKVLYKSRPVDHLLLPLRFFNLAIDLTFIKIAQMIIEATGQIESTGASVFLSLVLFLAYYFICEFYFQRTFGKLLTNSVVVDEYGEKPDFKTICIRTIIRFIPFEAFSFFWLEGDRWWHDTLTKTYVISKSELTLIKNKLAKES